MPEESRSLLAVGDALAADLLDALSRLRFEEATKDGDRRAGYRIRYSAVVERNLALPSQFPEGEERDEADEKAPVSACVPTRRRLGRTSTWTRASASCEEFQHHHGDHDETTIRMTRGAPVWPEV
jgi:hypothetical protein